MTPTSVLLRDGSGLTRGIDEVLWIFAGEEMPAPSDNKIDVLVDFSGDGQIKEHSTRVPQGIAPIQFQPCLVENSGSRALVLELPCNQIDLETTFEGFYERSELLKRLIENVETKFEQPFFSHTVPPVEQWKLLHQKAREEVKPTEQLETPKSIWASIEEEVATTQDAKQNT